jgi:acetylornithine deacetylase/succinyl-diaminopimelate desuccinylase-like protein
MIQQGTIREFVDAESKRFLDLLREACSLPSISAEGRGLAEMAAWLEDRLEAIGARVSRLQVPGAPPALLGEIQGSGGSGGPGGPGERTLMIYDHYDVQPVDPIDLWDSPPFEPEERGDRLYARGVADNKGDLVARLCAIEAYRELTGELPFAVKFFVEGEEEVGSPHFEQICRTYKEALGADHCVWEGWQLSHDGRPEVVYGCKGLLFLELRCRTLSGDQHSSRAVYAPSAAWRLVQALASMRDGEGRIAIEGFNDGIVQPGPREAELLDLLPFDEKAERERLGIDGFAGGLSGGNLKHALLYAPTANIAGILTGYTVPGAIKTVLPAEATAKMDLRLVPDQDVHDIAEKVRRHLAKHGFADVEVEFISGENPSRSPTDSLLGLAVETQAAHWFQEAPTVWPLMPATGPMHAIAQDLGIPICSPPGVSRPDSRIHAPNENIRIQDFLDIVGYTVSYLEAYGRA